MKNILCVGFKTAISALTNPIDRWSKRKGEHDPIVAHSKCVELDSGDIQLTWTGGSVARNIVIPRANVAYVEYDEAVPVKETAKK